MFFLGIFAYLCHGSVSLIVQWIQIERTFWGCLIFCWAQFIADVAISSSTAHIQPSPISKESTIQDPFKKRFKFIVKQLKDKPRFLSIFSVSFFIYFYSSPLSINPRHTSNTLSQKCYKIPNPVWSNRTHAHRSWWSEPHWNPTHFGCQYSDLKKGNVRAGHEKSNCHNKRSTASH